MQSERSYAYYADLFWRSYCAASCIDPAAPYVVDRFGDSPALADELVELVLHGPKRATAGLLLAYERSGEPVPQPEWLTVFLDGADVPRVIVRTLWTDIRPFNQVDAAFAWDEGDRSLADWKANHRSYFGRECAAIGLVFDDGMLVVLERFELVWPTA